MDNGASSPRPASKNPAQTSEDKDGKSTVGRGSQRKILTPADRYERQAFLVTSLGVAVLLFGVSMVTIAIVSPLTRSYLIFLPEYPPDLFFPGLGAIFLGLVTILFARTVLKDRADQSAISVYDLEVQTTIAKSDTNDPTMKNLLALNRKEMSQYHELTKQQARNSFTNSLVAMWAGLVVLACSLLVIVLPGLVPAETKLTVAGLGTVGTIVSGYITRTFLKQHSLSLQQLNSFFNQPLVSSYLLTAERVAGQLEGPDRAEALKRVVGEALDAAAIDDKKPAEGAKK